MIAEGYKDTEIGVIPIEWEVVKTDDVANVGAGTGFNVDYQGFLDKTTPFYKVSDMNLLGNEVFMNKANNYVDVEDISILKARKFPKNTLIFPKVGAALLTNKRRILSVEACVDNNIMTLVPNTDKINIIFLYSHYLQIDFNDFFNDGALPSLNASQVKNFKIPLPPLKEQEKIADILSTADAKIDAVALQIEKAETLKKGLLQKLLSEGIGHSEFKDSELGKIPESWEVVELNDLCSKIVGGGTPNSKIDDYWKNGTIYWATVKDMDNSKYLSKTQDTITDLGLKNSSANLIPANSIITATRMGLGRFFINTVDMAINQDLKALIIKERYDKNFIFWSLVSKSDFILSLGTGTTVKGIRLEEFKTIKFTIPPLREQKQIADILSTADEKLEVLRAKKEKYETLKKGLLQKLLSGEVRV